jgi:hypothetical protein
MSIKRVRFGGDGINSEVNLRILTLKKSSVSVIGIVF